MALTLISSEKTPTYLALSSDIADNKISGANIVGATVYLTDTGAWKIIKPDLTLAAYYAPTTPPA